MSKKDEALKLTLGKIKSARDCHPNAVNTLLFEAEEILEEALAEQPAQQQEPEYAWPTVADYERDVGFQTNEAFRIAWNMARTTNRMLGHASSKPAQRTWVGLTDEQLDDVYFCVEGGSSAIKTWREQARAIEAKLREKNT